MKMARGIWQALKPANCLDVFTSKLPLNKEAELWKVLMVEPLTEVAAENGKPLLLVRFFGTLRPSKGRDLKPSLMSAQIALRGLDARATSMEILHAEWVSMHRDFR
jgi:hypothetical protein